MKKVLFERWHVALVMTIATVVVSCIRMMQGGTVVAHRNFSGEPDRIGSSWEMLVIAAIAVVVFAVFRYAELHPEVGKMYVKPQAKAEGYRLLAKLNGSTNIALTALMFGVALLVAGWVSFNVVAIRIVFVVMAAIVIALTLSTTRKVNRLNSRTPSDESPADTELNMMEVQTEGLVNKRGLAVGFPLIPYIVLAGIFIWQLFFCHNDCSQQERVIFTIISITAIGCAVLAYMVSRTSLRGEMFSLANAKRMNNIGYVFAALGVLSLPFGIATKNLALVVIALLCLVVQYIVLLFVNVFVKSIRMKNEQDLTI